MRKGITLLDIIVIAVLGVVSLGGWVLASSFSGQSSMVTIDVQGRRQYILDLQREGIYEVKGPLGKSVVEIKDGRVRMKTSPCPGKLCVREGWIKRGAIVCVPNRVVVTVGVSLPEGIDAISG